MRILLITDQGPDSRHSAIRGIFDRHLRHHAEVTIAWFSRTHARSEAWPGHVVLPWRFRRHGWLWRYRPPVALDRFDIVIVRNLFPVLAGLQGQQPRTFRLGFWESFPHRYRRLYEAEQTGRALWRKRLEYAYFSRVEQRLVSRCDFYLPITATFAERFRPGLTIPTHPLPMGVETDTLPPLKPSHRAPGSPLRLLYAGAVDRLRGFDVILPALRALKVDFRLDIYTASRADEVRALGVDDPRIQFHAALPRTELLARMNDYDFGLSLIPPTPLYEVSSPTKTLEYFAMGLPAVMTPLPEHLSLFGDISVLFCPLDRGAIANTLLRLSEMQGAKELRHHGREKVLAERSYVSLTKQLLDWLAITIFPGTADIFVPLGVPRLPDHRL
ncbi:MAG: glycosyltransferase [Burkholderiales bacterium]